MIFYKKQEKGAGALKSTKFWLVLIGVVLALSAVLSALFFFGSKGHTVAQVYQDGVCIRTIDLERVDKPFSFTVQWEGGRNLIEVEHGRIRVAQADCPDGVCVRRGWSDQGVGPIACLPHKLVIQFTGGSTEVDGTTG